MQLEAPQDHIAFPFINTIGGSSSSSCEGLLAFKCSDTGYIYITCSWQVFVFPILQSPHDVALIFRTCQLHTAWELLHDIGGNERQAEWHGKLRWQDPGPGTSPGVQGCTSQPPSLWQPCSTLHSSQIAGKKMKIFKWSNSFT